MSSTDDSVINPAIHLTDPKYIGPGVWYNIHLDAYEATDNKKINEFMDKMHLLAEKFPCKTCRAHINEYINTHPFKDLKHLKNKAGRKIGMFKWAWLFHNAVNTRLHKPLVDWETAWSMYDEEIEICSKNCQSDDDHSENNQSDHENSDHDHHIEDLPTDPIARKDKLVQSYFMKVGIPNTLNQNGINDTNNMVTFRSY